MDNKKENEKAAQDHIANNKLNNLFKELINSVVHDQPTEPIPYMIKHLRTLLAKDDADLKDIDIDISDFHPNFKPVIKEFGFPKDTTAKIAEILNKKLFESLLSVKTKLGGHISHILNTAMKIGKIEEIGLYLTDADAYNAFKILIQAVFSKVNKFDSNNALYDLNHTNEIFSLKYAEKFREKIGFFRIRYSRNIENIPFLPYAKEHSQKLVKEKLIKAINEIELNGAEFYPFSDENKDDNFFKVLSNKFYDNEQSLLNHGINQHCGIIIPSTSNNKHNIEYAYLINFNDHLQIVCYNSSNKVDFRKCFEILDDKMNQISKKIYFEKTNEYGYATSCITNCGEALKITTGLNLPLLTKNGNFVFLLTEWDINHKFQNKVDNIGHNEIISKHRNGVDKNVFVNSYIIKICSLINYENKLTEDINYKIPQIAENYLSKKLKSIYNSHSRYLRFVVSPNGKGFNSIFKMDKNSKRFNLNFHDKESYIIFKNLLSDYIAEKTNVSMNLKKGETENKNLKKILNEEITEKTLEDLSEMLKVHSNEKLNRVYLIQRMNLKNFNFTNVISLPEKLEELKNTFLNLTQEIMKVVPGKLQIEDGLDVLYNSNFNLILEEIKEFSTIPNRNVMAYLTLDEAILVLFNGEDHIKIILNIESYEKIKEEFDYFKKIIDVIKPYCGFDQYFGYLTSNPNNSGSGFEIRMNFNSKDKKYLDDIKKQMRDFQLSRSLTVATNFDVYNKTKASFHGNEIIENVVGFLKAIAPIAPEDNTDNKKDLNIKSDEIEVETNIN